MMLNKIRRINLEKLKRLITTTPKGELYMIMVRPAVRKPITLILI